MIKIAFKLEKDTDDYPPADTERLWAKPLGGDQYELDNIPFFARGVSCEDIVQAEQEEGELVFRRIIRFAGHSTLRVIFFDRAKIEYLRGILKEKGCSSELSHLPNLISIDIPPGINLSPILEILKKGEVDNTWSYEEASIVPPLAIQSTAPPGAHLM